VDAAGWNGVDLPVGTGAKTLGTALPGGQFSVFHLYSALLNAQKSQVISPLFHTP
jgi:hypothetical protein